MLDASPFPNTFSEINKKRRKISKIKICDGIVRIRRLFYILSVIPRFIGSSSSGDGDGRLSPRAGGSHLPGRIPLQRAGPPDGRGSTLPK